MKTTNPIYNKILKLFFLSFLTVSFQSAFVYAETIPTKEVSGSISQSVVTEEEEIDFKNSCEHFDSTIVNVLNLESASEDTRQKIENVEDTIDSEITLRESILSSVRNFLGLQKKDKVIFREMKKDMNDAKTYYDTLDQKLEKTEKFLDENFCEDVALENAKKIDDETQNMVDDEDTYRKQFVASLKEKMKILQDSVKEAKK